MSDVSDVEMSFDSVEYEILTSPCVPTDLRGTVILCYNHDIQCRYRVVWVKPNNDAIADTFSCEFLRNFALGVCCKVKPISANLFHLYDTTGKHLIPLGKLSNCQSTFLLRMIWKPRELMKLHEADSAALRYLYHQCHDDFVYGDTIERISSRSLESLLGMVIFDMVAFALNSEPKIELKELKRRYRAKQFMNEKILTDIEPTRRFRALYRMINTFRINRNCRESLGKHYRDFAKQGSENSNAGALNVMLSYIKAITDNVPTYFCVTGQMAEKDKMVVIDHPQNRIYVRDSDGSKEELFDITKLQRHDGIGLSMAQVGNENGELNEVWTLSLHITKPQHDWQRIDLLFASSDEAHHIAAALVSLYQSVVLYPCHELTANELLMPPSVGKLKRSGGYHGPLSDLIAPKLMFSGTEQLGLCLLRQSPEEWDVYYVDAYGCSPRQQNDPQENPLPGPGSVHLLKFVIRSLDRKFRITECYDLRVGVNHSIKMIEPEFDCLCGPHGLLSYYKLPGRTVMLKEFIPPSLKHRAGFPIEAETVSEKQTTSLENVCSQPHIIPSSELEISDNLLGDGRFTLVYKAHWKRKLIAVKVVKAAEDTPTLERRLQMSTSRVLGLQSKFILDIYGFSVDTATQYVLLEYCSNGNISDFLPRKEVRRKLKKKHLLKVLRQMLNGLEFLHERHSYHGNLRCRNVFVMSFSDHDIAVKLGDPGLKNESPSSNNRLNISKDTEIRKDLSLYAETVCEMYSIWTPSERVIMSGMPRCPIHCPDELFDTVLSKCFNRDDYPKLTATDVSRDLTFFEQGFSGQNLAFFTSDVNRVGSCAVESESWLQIGASGGEPIVSSTLIDRVLLEYDEKKQTLGKGHFGQVFKGEYLGNPCAIKRLHQKYSDNVEQDKELEKEFEIMSQLKHKQIVEVFGRCPPIRAEGQAEPYLMVMELMEGKSVIDRMRDPDATNKFNADWLKDWALQIAQGLEYLHSKNIIHRDLACRNILVAKDYRCIKISDFGLARLLNDRNYYMCGQRELPMCWLAPEGFPGQSNARCVTASDIWSYGIVLWELFSYGKQPKDEEPYRTHDSYKLLFKLFSKTPTRLSKPDNCPDEMYQLMTNCWKFAHSIRPSASEITKLLSVE